MIISSDKVDNKTISQVLINSGDEEVDGIYTIKVIETDTEVKSIVNYKDTEEIAITNKITDETFLNGEKLDVVHSDDNVDNIEPFGNNDVTWETYDTKKKGTTIAGMTLSAIFSLLVNWCPNIPLKLISAAASAYSASYIGMSVYIRKQRHLNYNGTYKVGMRTRYDLYADRNWQNHDRTWYTNVTTR